MPRRSFQRSQSLAVPPPDLSDRAFRRATRELRDFHRSRSLEVIFENPNDSNDSSHSNGGGTLKKKGACLCLADLVEESHDADGSENTNEQDAGEEGQGRAFADRMESHNGCWGHFTADSPSPGVEAESAFHHHNLSSHHRTRLYPAFTIKGRTVRGFARP